LQAFVHQAKEYAVRNKYNESENWHISKLTQKEEVPL